jgi:hypothetical protein
MHGSARRVARLEQRAAAVQPGTCAVRSRDQSPEEAATVLGIQLPAIDPPMPPGLGPMRFGINGPMRHRASRAVLVVPHAALGLQRGAVDGGGPARLRRGIE